MDVAVVAAAGLGAVAAGIAVRSGHAAVKGVAALAAGFECGRRLARAAGSAGGSVSTEVSVIVAEMPAASSFGRNSAGALTAPGGGRRKVDSLLEAAHVAAAI